MWAYIVRRLLYTPLIVFGVLLITFLLFRIVPGDPARMQAGRYASEELIQDIREQMGYDKPLFLNIEAAREDTWWRAFDSQFFNYIYETVTFQFGRSYFTNQRISTTLLHGAIPSLKLTIPMLAGLLLISLSASLLIAYVRGTVWDVTTVVVCVAGMSVPMLAIILFGQWYFAGKLGWFPIQGYESGWAGVRYYVLPVLLGIIAGLGAEVRFYRTVMLDEVHADYIRTAYAKGVGTRKVLFKHLLKNAMIPVITKVVITIPFLFLGSLLLERFFGIPGLGYLMIEAINQRDLEVIAALTYIISLLFIVGQLMTDISYALVDPRVSLE